MSQDSKGLTDIPGAPAATVDEHDEKFAQIKLSAAQELLELESMEFEELPCGCGMACTEQHCIITGCSGKVCHKGSVYGPCPVDEWKKNCSPTSITVMGMISFFLFFSIIFAPIYESFMLLNLDYVFYAFALAMIAITSSPTLYQMNSQWQLARRNTIDCTRFGDSICGCCYFMLPCCTMMWDELYELQPNRKPPKGQTLQELQYFPPNHAKWMLNKQRIQGDAGNLTVSAGKGRNVDAFSACCGPTHRIGTIVSYPLIAFLLVGPTDYVGFLQIYPLVFCYAWMWTRFYGVTGRNANGTEVFVSARGMLISIFPSILWNNCFPDDVDENFQCEGGRGFFKPGPKANECLFVAATESADYYTKPGSWSGLHFRFDKTVRILGVLTTAAMLFPVVTLGVNDFYAFSILSLSINFLCSVYLAYVGQPSIHLRKLLIALLHEDDNEDKHWRGHTRPNMIRIILAYASSAATLLIYAVVWSQFSGEARSGGIWIIAISVLIYDALVMLFKANRYIKDDPEHVLLMQLISRLCLVIFGEEYWFLGQCVLYIIFTIFLGKNLIENSLPQDGVSARLNAFNKAKNVAINKDGVIVPVFTAEKKQGKTPYWKTKFGSNLLMYILCTVPFIVLLLLVQTGVVIAPKVTLLSNSISQFAFGYVSLMISVGGSFGLFAQRMLLWGTENGTMHKPLNFCFIMTISIIFVILVAGSSIWIWFITESIFIVSTFVFGPFILLFANILLRNWRLNKHILFKPCTCSSSRAKTATDNDATADSDDGTAVALDEFKTKSDTKVNTLTKNDELVLQDVDDEPPAAPPNPPESAVDAEDSAVTAAPTSTAVASTAGCCTCLHPDLRSNLFVFFNIFFLCGSVIGYGLWNYFKSSAVFGSSVILLPIVAMTGYMPIQRLKLIFHFEKEMVMSAVVSIVTFIGYLVWLGVAVDRDLGEQFADDTSIQNGSIEVEVDKKATRYVIIGFVAIMYPLVWTIIVGLLVQTQNDGKPTKISKFLFNVATFIILIAIVIISIASQDFYVFLTLMSIFVGLSLLVKTFYSLMDRGIVLPLYRRAAGGYVVLTILLHYLYIFNLSDDLRYTYINYFALFSYWMTIIVTLSNSFLQLIDTEKKQTIFSAHLFPVYQWNLETYECENVSGKMLNGISALVMISFFGTFCITQGEYAFLGVLICCGMAVTLVMGYIYFSHSGALNLAKTSRYLDQEMLMAVRDKAFKRFGDPNAVDEEEEEHDGVDFMDQLWAKTKGRKRNNAGHDGEDDDDDGDDDDDDDDDDDGGAAVIDVSKDNDDAGARGADDPLDEYFPVMHQKKEKQMLDWLSEDLKWLQRYAPGETYLKIMIMNQRRYQEEVELKAWQHDQDILNFYYFHLYHAGMYLIEEQERQLLTFLEKHGLHGATAHNIRHWSPQVLNKLRKEMKKSAAELDARKLILMQEQEKQRKGRRNKLNLSINSVFKLETQEDRAVVLTYIENEIKKYKATGKPFKDDDFKPYAVYGQFDNWRRPVDMNNDAKVVCFDEGIEPSDLHQGQLGDCWFIAAMANVAQRPNMIRALFLGAAGKEDGFDLQEAIDAGIYAVQLYEHGSWWAVVVDDRMPCNQWGSDFVLAKSRREDIFEMWPSVLEKAYAKLFHSNSNGYEQLEGGLVTMGITALTGQPGRTYKHSSDLLQSNRLWNMIKRYQDNGFLLGASSAGESDTQRSEGNIVQRHAFSILDVKSVHGYKMIKLRNPYGNTEWTGAWSDESPLWDQHPYMKETLNVTVADDGVFWMQYEDYIRHYDGTGVNIVSRGHDATLYEQSIVWNKPEDWDHEVVEQKQPDHEEALAPGERPPPESIIELPAYKGGFKDVRKAPVAYLRSTGVAHVVITVTTPSRPDVDEKDSLAVEASELHIIATFEPDKRNITSLNKKPILTVRQTKQEHTIMMTRGTQNGHIALTACWASHHAHKPLKANQKLDPKHIFPLKISVRCAREDAGKIRFEKGDNCRFGARKSDKKNERRHTYIVE